MTPRFQLPALMLILVAGTASAAQDASTRYASMAPIERYRIADRAEEIALAKSAAPADISADADVLVLGTHGYETAAKGTNGFVCIVERSWANRLDDPEFWNPSVRAPMCYNAAAARSVLPPYLQRTDAALAGRSRLEIRDRIKADLAGHTHPVPETAAMCYMLSNRGHLGDAPGHWLPHVMFFLPHVDAAAFGGNRPGSPVIVNQGDPEPETVIVIPVSRWSDGSPAPTDHTM
ncbi:MAG TPA: hypothetical protein VGG73_19145 [Vicinamibacterales bacterium]